MISHYSDRLRPVCPSGTAAIDCAGARVSAHLRGPATVLVVEGEIDICNADRVVAGIRRLNRAGTPFVLDLRAVDFMSVSGFRELLAFADECRQGYAAWHVVAGNAVRPLLRVFADHGLPVVGSTGPAVGCG